MYFREVKGMRSVLWFKFLHLFHLLCSILFSFLFFFFPGEKQTDKKPPKSIHILSTNVVWRITSYYRASPCMCIHSICMSWVPWNLNWVRAHYALAISSWSMVMWVPSLPSYLTLTLQQERIVYFLSSLSFNFPWLFYLSGEEHPWRNAP